MSLHDAAFLVSDLHLEEARPELTEAFVDFLGATAAGAAALYILGDLFNLWIGDDAPPPLAGRIGAALSSVAARGTAVFLMHGNRDFLMGPDLAARCRATLLEEPHLLEHAGRRYLLMHGDSLCTRDTGYMEFRAQVRDPAWQRGFLALPREERWRFAEQARARSRAMTGNKPEDIMDVTQEEVEKVMLRHGVDTLIHGHTHRPARHRFAMRGLPARRFVLGDWERRGWYLRLGPEGEELVNFPIK